MPLACGFGSGYPLKCLAPLGITATIPHAFSKFYQMTCYPAEWEPQSATWLAMPTNDNWAQIRAQINAFYDKLINTISKFQKVRILDELNIPYNDIWIRDYGPFFVENHPPLTTASFPANGADVEISVANAAANKPRKELAIVKFEFNAWGEKFPPWDADNAVPEHIAKLLNISIEKQPYILEGGAMEFNGDGLCLTTEPCLWGKKRNRFFNDSNAARNCEPPLSSSQASSQETNSAKQNALQNIKLSLGIKSLKILPRGLDGDHTDGHIDNLARFVAKNHVVIAEGFEAEKKEIEKWLAEFYENAKVDILPLPKQIILETSPNKEALPASYMNFIFVNGALLVPTYNCENDKTALNYFKKVFPDREIIGLDCTMPIQEGGSLHCLSKQQPLVNA